MKKVITTVGTSIFSNYNQKGNFDFDNWKNKKANAFKDSDKRKEADYELKPIQKWATKENASAEIASLVKIQQELKVPIEVHLVCTDTALSVMAAECICHYFSTQQNGISIHPNLHIVDDLRIDDKPTFEKGLRNLFETIDKEIIDKKDNKRIWENIVLNITGGYKALIPHLTILGQIFRCPIFYVFDDSDPQIRYELMQVPSLPISFDWLVAEIYGQMLSSDTILQKLLGQDASGKDFEKLKKFGLITEQKKVDTFGTLMWQYLNSYMPESPSVLGFFVEMKVYEFFNENRGGYELKPDRSVEFFWDKKDDSTISLEKHNNWDLRTEIDLILRGANDDYAIVEVKTMKKVDEFIGDKAAKRVDTKIKTTTTFYKKPPKEFIVVAHKHSAFDIDDDSLKTFRDIQELAGDIPCKFYYADFEAKRDRETLNFSSFLNKNLELKLIELN